MNSYSKKLTLILVVLFVCITSAVKTIPVYADDETPPEDVSAIEPVEAPDQTTAQEEASPLSTHEADPESVLPPLPEGTDLVVLDEQGMVVPLATTEAVEVMASSDPIWCPVGITPTPGMNGCTQSFGQFVTGNPMTGLLDYLQANQPDKDGVIWVETTYNGQDNTNIIFDGSTTFASMANFALTINGGWDISTNAMDLSTPSTFDVSLQILNWKNAVTLNNILVAGTAADGIKVSTTGNINLDHIQSNTNAGDGAELFSTGGAVVVKNSQFIGNTNQYGLVVDSTVGDITLNSVIANSNNNSGIHLITPGNINLTNVVATNNGWYGADLDNTSGSGNVTIGSGQFNGNNLGLYVLSHGTITLKDITANGNATTGSYLQNITAASPKAVILNGTNTFSNNGTGDGLNVLSMGAITINNITASMNGNYGVHLDNNNPGASGAVTLMGFNVFSGNDLDGLIVYSNGAIKVNNLISIANGGSGIWLDNQTAITPQSVTLSGTIMAKYNLGVGLFIRSLGVVTASNLTLNYNDAGADIDNTNFGAPASVVLSGINSFSHNNQSSGLSIISSGLISLSNIAANENAAGSGAYLNNISAPSPMDIIISGTNSFNNNFANGLHALSYGSITINNLNANGNGSAGGGTGATLGNMVSPGLLKPITITGVSSLSNNHESGLSVQTYGAITLANMTASNNGLNATTGSGYGLNINNGFGTIAAPVTFSGTSVFNDNYETNLNIYSLGLVTVNNITANNSIVGVGAMINNQSGTAGVKVTGVNTLNGNEFSNLWIQSRGAISINSVSANNSGSEFGIYLQNIAALSAAPITISGVTTANGNWLTGIKVTSTGLINVNSLTAMNNGAGSVNSSDYGVTLDNAGATSPLMVTLGGTNRISANHGTNLMIITNGDVKINNLTANDSATGNGAYLWNSNIGTAVNTTLSGVNVLTGNNMDNLHIQTMGAVSLSNITANNSITGHGAFIANTGALTPKAVTISGVNSFNANHVDGLNIETLGMITISNITANGNGSAGLGRGATLVNNAGALAPVILNGYGIFKNNQEDGLRIHSKGDITISNLTATGNNLRGAWLTNNTTGKGITLKGQNIFNNNGFNGLEISSSGAVLLNNITANSNLNNSYGAYIDNAQDNFLKPVTLTGQNTFNGNSYAGLAILSYGVVTTNNITASNTINAGIYGYAGMYIENHLGSGSPNVIMNGVNVFNSNGGTGVGVFSKGGITAGNITAMFNGQMAAGTGAVFNNTFSTSFTPITLTGKNNFSGNNGAGLLLSSAGAILTNNVIANDNIESGASFNNTQSGTATPKTVTMLGFNQFNNNGNYGLTVSSYGTIITNNLTANFNDADNYIGVILNNGNAVKAASVFVNGTNTFNGNDYGGLSVYSVGSVTLNNITANGTLDAVSRGVMVDNHTGASSASVTITGTNNFNNNYYGLDIWSNGVVKVTRITADDNNHSGLNISTNGNVSVMCASLTNNTNYGWAINIPSPAVATLQGVVSVGNGVNNELFPNTGTLVKSVPCPLP